MAGTITRLQLQKGNQERVNVYLDDVFAFGLDILTAAQLYKGQVLTDAAIAELQDGNIRKRAYFAAVRLLGSRPRSISEIVKALQRKEYAEDVIEHAVQRLQTEGFLNDAEFARYWSENRTQFRPRSARALRYELRQKGVDSADIDPAVEDLDEDQAALAALQSRLRLWQRLPEEDARQKAIAFLARRGFSYTIANRAWQSSREHSDSDEDSGA